MLKWNSLFLHYIFLNICCYIAGTKELISEWTSINQIKYNKGTMIQCWIKYDLWVLIYITWITLHLKKQVTASIIIIIIQLHCIMLSVVYLLILPHFLEHDISIWLEIVKPPMMGQHWINAPSRLDTVEIKEIKVYLIVYIYPWCIWLRVHYPLHNVMKQRIP